jgi:hypothetical protein
MLCSLCVVQVSTCHLEVGKNKGASMVKFEHCFDKPHPLQAATRLQDLCYDPHARKDQC